MITRVTGQDRSYLSEFLLEKGYEVHGTTRRSSVDYRNRIAHLKGYSRFHLSIHFLTFVNHFKYPTYVLNVLTKGEIVSVIRKLDGYISPNLKKADTAICAAGMILEEPMQVLEDPGMDGLKLVKEFVQAGPDTYVPRRMRRTPYKLQKYALVLTHEDDGTQRWEMLMPDEVREAFAPHIDSVIARKGKHPRKMTRKEKCMAALAEYLAKDK